MRRFGLLGTWAGYPKRHRTAHSIGGDSQLKGQEPGLHQLALSSPTASRALPARHSFICRLWRPRVLLCRRGERRVGTAGHHGG